MSLESKTNELIKEVEKYRQCELENKNRLKNPWFRAWRDSLLFSTDLLVDAQKLESTCKGLAKDLDAALRVGAENVRDYQTQLAEAKKEISELKTANEFLNQENNTLGKLATQIAEANNLVKLLDELWTSKIPTNNAYMDHLILQLKIVLQISQITLKSRIARPQGKLR